MSASVLLPCTDIEPSCRDAYTLRDVELDSFVTSSMNGEPTLADGASPEMYVRLATGLMQTCKS